MISGFLITHLLRIELERTSHISLRNFYIRRVLRIFPPMYLYLGIVVLLKLLGEIPLGIPNFIAALFFLSDYTCFFLPESSSDWVIAHFWSLSVEEQFYFLWPLAFLLLKPRKAAILCFIIIGLSPILRFATYFLFVEQRSYLTSMLHCTADPLLIGCLLALLAQGARFNLILNQCSYSLYPTAAFGILLLVSPLLVLAAGNYYWFSLGIPLNSAAVAFLISWFIRYPSSRVGVLLESRPFRYLGQRSYGLYLWQELILSNYFDGTWLAITPINFCTILLIAEFSYQTVERPLIKLRSRYRKKNEANLESHYEPKC